ncbi:class C sortase [Eubacterium callanderi]|uniref:class C sortase n=1 Tax=Eubacterium callanderi TaxID=53442 RepID=UPI001AA145D7|nr:class C sortase [Eubacterium callanderi]MBO1702903.1 class C sortase [Eubacterium callanderi]
MKRILSNMAITLMFIIGACFLAYPIIANLLSNRQHGEVIQDYQITVEQMNASVMAEEKEKALAYNQGLNGMVAHDPFIEGSGYVLPENYLDCLNVDGIMGTLVIDKIKINLPIYHGTRDEVLRQGVGHIKETALPIGGEGSHAVLTSHSGLNEAKLFTELDQLTEGDTFEIHVLDEILTYKVDQIKVVEPNQTDELKAVPGKDYVTLLTCTPIGVNSHRLLVRGERIFPEPQAEEIKETVNRSYVILAVATVVLVPIVLLSINWAINRNGSMR